MARGMSEKLSPGVPSRANINLVKLDDLDLDFPVDFHMHTSHTDGTATVREMAEASASASVKQVLYTEHVRHTSTYYPSFVEDVQSQQIDGLEIFVGVETKVCDLDGSLDCSPTIASLTDGIVGSVHNPPLDDSGTERHWKDLEPEAALELEFQLAMAIVTKSRAHILGHPMGMAIRRFNQNPLEQIYALACACRDEDKAFELNPRYCADLDQWLQAVRTAGCKVSLGSDAHKTADVGRAWRVFVLGEGLPDGTSELLYGGISK